VGELPTIRDLNANNPAECQAAFLMFESAMAVSGNGQRGL